MAVYCFLIGCGGGGIIVGDGNSAPLGTYTNVNHNPLAVQTAFPDGANTCLGLFDSSITLLSDTLAIETRRYLMPPVITLNGISQAIIVEGPLSARVTRLPGNLYAFHHGSWDDTASYSHMNGSDILTMREIFDSMPTCSLSSRVSIGYSRS